MCLGTGYGALDGRLGRGVVDIVDGDIDVVAHPEAGTVISYPLWNLLLNSFVEKSKELLRQCLH